MNRYSSIKQEREKNLSANRKNKVATSSEVPGIYPFHSQQEPNLFSDIPNPFALLHMFHNKNVMQPGFSEKSQFRNRIHSLPTVENTVQAPMNISTPPAIDSEWLKLFSQAFNLPVESQKVQKMQTSSIDSSLQFNHKPSYIPDLQSGFNDFLRDLKLGSLPPDIPSPESFMEFVKHNMQKSYPVEPFKNEHDVRRLSNNSLKIPASSQQSFQMANQFQQNNIPADVNDPNFANFLQDMFKTFNPLPQSTDMEKPVLKQKRKYNKKNQLQQPVLPQLNKPTNPYEQPFVDYPFKPPPPSQGKNNRLEEQPKTMSKVTHGIEKILTPHLPSTQPFKKDQHLSNNYNGALPDQIPTQIMHDMRHEFENFFKSFVLPSQPNIQIAEANAAIVTPSKTQGVPMVLQPPTSTPEKGFEYSNQKSMGSKSPQSITSKEAPVKKIRGRPPGSLNKNSKKFKLHSEYSNQTPNSTKVENSSKLTATNGGSETDNVLKCLETGKTVPTSSTTYNFSEDDPFKFPPPAIPNLPGNLNQDEFMKMFPYMFPPFPQANIPPNFADFVSDAQLNLKNVSNQALSFPEFLKHHVFKNNPPASESSIKENNRRNGHAKKSLSQNGMQKENDEFQMANSPPSNHSQQLEGEVEEKRFNETAADTNNKSGRCIKNSDKFNDSFLSSMNNYYMSGNATSQQKNWEQLNPGFSVFPPHHQTPPPPPFMMLPFMAAAAAAAASYPPPPQPLIYDNSPHHKIPAKGGQSSPENSYQFYNQFNHYYPSSQKLFLHPDNPSDPEESIVECSNSKRAGQMDSQKYRKKQAIQVSTPTTQLASHRKDIPNFEEFVSQQYELMKGFLDKMQEEDKEIYDTDNVSRPEDKLLQMQQQRQLDFVKSALDYNLKDQQAININNSRKPGRPPQKPYLPFEMSKPILTQQFKNVGKDVKLMNNNHQHVHGEENVSESTASLLETSDQKPPVNKSIKHSMSHHTHNITLNKSIDQAPKKRRRLKFNQKQALSNNVNIGSTTLPNISDGGNSCFTSPFYEPLKYGFSRKTLIKSVRISRLFASNIYNSAAPLPSQLSNCSSRKDNSSAGHFDIDTKNISQNCSGTTWQINARRGIKALVKGEVTYVSPCGKRLRSYQDAERYLEKIKAQMQFSSQSSDPIVKSSATKLEWAYKLNARNHFSFSSRTLAGKYYRISRKNHPDNKLYKYNEKRLLKLLEELLRIYKPPSGPNSKPTFYDVVRNESPDDPSTGHPPISSLTNSTNFESLEIDISDPIFDLIHETFLTQDHKNPIKGEFEEKVGDCGDEDETCSITAEFFEVRRRQRYQHFIGQDGTQYIAAAPNSNFTSNSYNDTAKLSPNSSNNDTHNNHNNNYMSGILLPDNLETLSRNPYLSDEMKSEFLSALTQTFKTNPPHHLSGPPMLDPNIPKHQGLIKKKEDLIDLKLPIGASSTSMSPTFVTALEQIQNLISSHATNPLLQPHTKAGSHKIELGSDKIKYLQPESIVHDDYSKAVEDMDVIHYSKKLPEYPKIGDELSFETFAQLVMSIEFLQNFGSETLKIDENIMRHHVTLKNLFGSIYENKMINFTTTEQEEYPMDDDKIKCEINSVGTVLEPSCNDMMMLMIKGEPLYLQMLEQQITINDSSSQAYDIENDLYTFLLVYVMRFLVRNCEELIFSGVDQSTKIERVINEEPKHNTDVRGPMEEDVAAQCNDDKSDVFNLLISPTTSNNFFQITDMAFQNHNVGIFGKGLREMDINSYTVSEVIRFYLKSRLLDTFQPMSTKHLLRQVFEHLEKCSLASIPSPELKLCLLTFLSDEVLASNSDEVERKMERELEQLAIVRKDKWLNEGHIRKIKYSSKDGGNNDEFSIDENFALRIEDTIESVLERSPNKVLMTEPCTTISVHADIKKQSRSPDNSMSKENLKENPETRLANAQEEKNSRLNYRKKLFNLTSKIRCCCLGQDRFKRRYWLMPYLQAILVEGAFHDTESIHFDQENEYGNKLMGNSKQKELTDIAKSSVNIELCNENTNLNHIKTQSNNINITKPSDTFSSNSIVIPSSSGVPIFPVLLPLIQNSGTILELIKSNQVILDKAGIHLDETESDNLINHREMAILNNSSIKNLSSYSTSITLPNSSCPKSGDDCQECDKFKTILSPLFNSTLQTRDSNTILNQSGVLGSPMNQNVSLVTGSSNNSQEVVKRNQTIPNLNSKSAAINNKYVGKWWYIPDRKCLQKLNRSLNLRGQREKLLSKNLHKMNDILESFLDGDEVDDDKDLITNQPPKNNQIKEFMQYILNTTKNAKNCNYLGIDRIFAENAVMAIFDFENQIYTSGLYQKNIKLRDDIDVVESLIAEQIDTSLLLQKGSLKLLELQKILDRRYLRPPLFKFQDSFNSSAVLFWYTEYMFNKNANKISTSKPVNDNDKLTCNSTEPKELKVLSLDKSTDNIFVSNSLNCISNIDDTKLIVTSESDDLKPRDNNALVNSDPRSPKLETVKSLKPLKVLSCEKEYCQASLNKWRDVLCRGTTNPAQLHLCLAILKHSLCWDKSISKIFCQYCHKGNKEDKLMICDGCDNGYHNFCFKPKIDIPDSDWYCFHCVSKALEEPMCCLCGRRADNQQLLLTRPGGQFGTSNKPITNLIKCDKCTRFYHKTCFNPPIIRNINRLRWKCPFCFKLQRKNLLGLTTTNKYENALTLDERSINQYNSMKPYLNSTSSSFPLNNTWDPRKRQSSLPSFGNNIKSFRKDEGKNVIDKSGPFGDQIDISGISGLGDNQHQPGTKPKSQEEYSDDYLASSYNTNIKRNNLFINELGSSRYIREYNNSRAPRMRGGFKNFYRTYNKYYHQRRLYHYQQHRITNVNDPSNSDTTKSLNEPHLMPNNSNSQLMQTPSYEESGLIKRNRAYRRVISRKKPRGGLNRNGMIRKKYRRHHLLLHQQLQEHAEDKPYSCVNPSPKLLAYRKRGRRPKYYNPHSYDDSKAAFIIDPIPLESAEINPTAPEQLNIVKFHKKEYPPIALLTAIESYETTYSLDNCREIIETLKRSEHSWPFLEPVNLEIFPTYANFVANPIDFSVIDRKLKDGSYVDANQVFEDVSLIFSNCRAFNEDNSLVSIACAHLNKLFHKTLQSIAMSSNAL